MQGTLFDPYTLFDGIDPKPTNEGEELETNQQGGKGSKLGLDYTLVPPAALAEVARVMYKGGQKYGNENWHSTSIMENLNHALAHLSQTLYLLNRHPDNRSSMQEELAHASCRSMMSYELLAYINPGYIRDTVKDKCKQVVSKFTEEGEVKGRPPR